MGAFLCSRRLSLRRLKFTLNTLLFLEDKTHRFLFIKSRNVSQFEKKNLIPIFHCESASVVIDGSVCTVNTWRMFNSEFNDKKFVQKFLSAYFFSVRKHDIIVILGRLSFHQFNHHVALATQKELGLSASQYLPQSVKNIALVSGCSVFALDFRRLFFSDVLCLAPCVSHPASAQRRADGSSDCRLQIAGVSGHCLLSC